MPDEPYNESDLERWQGEIAYQESERWGPPTDKRCGTCRWWKLAAGGDSFGFCFRPVPEWVPENIWLQYHGRLDWDGMTCKLWEARDEV